MRARNHRRAFAISIALLWLLAAEVLPNLHLGAHHHDHTHAPNGTIVAQHADDHDDELERLHQLAHRQAGTKCLHRTKRTRDRLAIERAPHGHAAAGIAHRAAAVLDPPPPVVAPLAVPHAERWQHDAPNARIAIAHAAPPSARGPPVA